MDRSFLVLRGALLFSFFLIVFTIILSAAQLLAGTSSAPIPIAVRGDAPSVNLPL